MENVAAGSMDLTWDPHARIAVLQMSPHGTGGEAKVLIEAITRWIGTDGKPFALLVDTTAEGGEGQADWRSAWGAFYVAHSGDGVIAGFGASPAMQIAGALFSAGTGVRLQLFTKEAEAREWLRGLGFVA